MVNATDGMTLLPGEYGKNLLWDVTCVDTLAQSNFAHSLRKPGEAVTLAKGRNVSKYQELADGYIFKPLGFETVGHWGEVVICISFINKIGRELAVLTMEPCSGAFLRQRISIAIQRGNACSNNMTKLNNMDQIFNLPMQAH